MLKGLSFGHLPRVMKRFAKHRSVPSLFSLEKIIFRNQLKVNVSYLFEIPIVTEHYFRIEISKILIKLHILLQKFKTTFPKVSLQASNVSVLKTSANHNLLDLKVSLQALKKHVPKCSMTSALPISNL